MEPRSPRFDPKWGCLLALILAVLPLAGCDSNPESSSGSTPGSTASAPAPSQESSSDSGAPISGFTFKETNEQGYPEYEHKKSKIVFVKLPGGTYQMGSPPSEAGRAGDEGPVHTVTVGPFLIAKYEVKQAKWSAVVTQDLENYNKKVDQARKEGGDLPPETDKLGLLPGGFSNKPVAEVSWKDCNTFCGHVRLDLPTEAQWEYACRAGTSTPFSFGGTVTPEEVNYDGDYPYYDGAPPGLDRQGTVEVGTLPANGFGLHDMHGNVGEWCKDFYNFGFYASANASGVDPVYSKPTGLRVVRGGTWARFAKFCRSAARNFAHPMRSFKTIGFRPVKNLRPVKGS